MVNLECELDWVERCLGDEKGTLLSVYVRMFPRELTRVKTRAEYG
jgi:hypothetical protein